MRSRLDLAEVFPTVETGISNKSVAGVVDPGLRKSHSTGVSAPGYIKAAWLWLYSLGSNTRYEACFGLDVGAGLRRD